jgi:hypothetical protein
MEELQNHMSTAYKEEEIHTRQRQNVRGRRHI